MSKIALKKVVKAVLPPIVTSSVGTILYKVRTRNTLPNGLRVATEGWVQISSDAGWNSKEVVQTKRKAWALFKQKVMGTGPLGFTHESTDPDAIRDLAGHNLHLTFAYVIALASRSKSHLSVLDWGGGLGQYYWVAKTTVPDLEVEYHCKELEALATEGQKLNPEVSWSSDDACLESKYDLVISSGSLQCHEDWKKILKQLCHASSRYLFLTRIPVTLHSPSFLTVQTAYGTEMMHWIFNQDEIFRELTASNFHLVREFIVGEATTIDRASTAHESRGWLFVRR